MKVSIRTLRACLRQINLQMSDGAIAKNERISQATILKIKNIAESTELSINELLEQTESELNKLFQIKQKKKFRKNKSVVLSAKEVGKNGR